MRAACPKDNLEFKFCFFEPWNGDDLDQNRKGLPIISSGQRLQDCDIQVPKQNNEIAPRNKLLTSFSLSNSQINSRHNLDFIQTHKVR